MKVNNGCGPASIKYVPQWLLEAAKRLLFNWFFEASCSKHDEGYYKGGNECRRFECDWKFWLAMRRDTLRYKGIKRLVRWVQAITFFVLVRGFGWIRFNYHNKQ